MSVEGPHGALACQRVHIPQSVCASQASGQAVELLDNMQCMRTQTRRPRRARNCRSWRVPFPCTCPATRRALRAQEFVELVRAEQLLDALKYARAHLAPWAGAHLPELQRALAALAFRAGTACEPYAALFAPAAWARLAELFRCEVYRLHSLPPESQLVVHLQARLCWRAVPCDRAPCAAEPCNCGAAPAQPAVPFPGVQGSSAAQQTCGAEGRAACTAAGGLAAGCAPRGSHAGSWVWDPLCTSVLSYVRRSRCAHLANTQQ